MPDIKKVECQLCNSNMLLSRLPRHIKTTHKNDILSWQHYLELYIDTVPNYNNCIICNKICTTYKNITCSKECQIKHYSNAHKGLIAGIPKTEEHKKKLSETRKRMYAEGLLISNGAEIGKREDVKEKIRQKIMKRIELNGGKGLRQGAVLSQYTKDLIGKKAIEGFSNGTRIAYWKDKKLPPDMIKKIIEHRPMNSLEKRFSILLNSLNIQYYFQFFINNGIICKSYDFKIKNKNILIEVDGDYWHGNPNSDTKFDKWEDVQKNDRIKDNLANENNYSIIRFWESDINNNIKLVTNKINECLDLKD